jgi:hypothetical protein
MHGGRRFAPKNRGRLSGPGLRVFLAIADLWRLTVDERRLILGNPSRLSYKRWVRAARQHGELMLEVDTLMRISAVLGIHAALRVLNVTEREGVEWLRQPHKSPVFGGKAPLALVTSGTLDGLMTVRGFLDGARGGIYMEPNEVDRDFTPYDDSEIVFR